MNKLTDMAHLTYTEESHYPNEEIIREAQRLYNKLSHLNWTLEICKDIAPYTLEINFLKKQRNSMILAHSYQTPDIIFGVADYVGDSYYLSKVAQDNSTKKDEILFAGVYFMAETTKILNPKKRVLIPDPTAGCSLSESITSENIRQLKLQFPEVPVVTYINTSAEVKAESDVIVTSANAVKVLKALGEKKVIFLPDKYMAQNLKNICLDIEFITWNGSCIVHDEFSKEKIQFYRGQFGDELEILVHTECAPEVVEEADLAGGTGDMINYIEKNPSKSKFMLVTECGLVDRLRIEYPDREFVGSCNLCPYMKKINLHNILETFKQPQPENIIEIDEKTRKKAYNALQRMFDLSK